MKQQIYTHPDSLIEQEFRNVYKELNNLGGGGNFFNLLSPAEIAVGTWVDGKTIYRQVATVVAYPNATNATILTIPDIDRILFSWGYAHSGSTTYTIPSPGSNTSNHDCCLVGQSGTDIVILTTSNWTTYSGYIVCYYTK